MILSIVNFLFGYCIAMLFVCLWFFVWFIFGLFVWVFLFIYLFFHFPMFFYLAFLVFHVCNFNIIYDNKKNLKKILKLNNYKCVALKNESFGVGGIKIT